MAAPILHDEDLNSFLDQFDDLSDPELTIDGKLNDLFPAIWTQPSLLELNPVPVPVPVPSGTPSEIISHDFSTRMDSANKQRPNNESRSFSPVSILESSRTSSSLDHGKTMLVTLTVAPVQGRARTKRYRPPTFNPRSSAHHLVPAAWPWPRPRPLPENLSGSVEKVSNAEMHLKFRKSKNLRLSSPIEIHQNQNKNPNSPLLQAEADRKCTHCDITKTPQWRACPMGPKTLCNACGVRYKSGRLFPEYRPAASPTFSPTRHSNSHKKVLEMRRNTEKSDHANTCAHIIVKASKGAEKEFAARSNASSIGAIGWVRDAAN